MATAICTISSSSHLFKVKALFRSLEKITDADLHCLITDHSAPSSNDTEFKTHTLAELKDDLSIELLKKYTGNKLRWACKSIFLRHLLSNGYDAVIYVDNDICFYTSPDFLFEQLQKQHILLTPHYYPADPKKDQNWMEANYRVGLYNGGFIGVNKKAIPALTWWAECCLYNIKKSYWRGLFDDQKYLDLIPVLYNHVEVVRHKGCNVAGWNILTSPRSIDSNGEIQLDGTWPLVFIHFNYYTIQCMVNDKDPLLKKHWDQYHSMLASINPQYNYKTEINSLSRNIREYFQYIRYRIARLFE